MANAFAPILSPRYYGGSQENPMGYGSFPADQQLIDWQEQLQKYPRIYGAGMGYGQAPRAPQTQSSGGQGGVSVSGPWGSFTFNQPGGGGSSSSNAGSTGAGGFPLLQTPKSPAGNAALESILGQTASLSNNPNQPIFTTTKDPAQAGDISAARAGYQSDTAQQRQTLADFTKNFLAADPQAKSYMTQETGAIGEFYGPESDPNSVAGSLARLLRQRKLAVAGSLQRAMAQSARRGNLARLGFGGSNSYADQQFMDSAAGILAGEAGTQADIARGNYLGVKDAQTKLAGARAGLLNNYLTRNLIPLDANQRLLSGQLANLGQLGNITNANSLYQTPEQLLSARLGLVGQYGQDLNALNIFGVGGNFPSPAANWGNPYGMAPSMGPTGTVQNQVTDPVTGQPRQPGGSGGIPPEYANADPETRMAALQYYQSSGRWPSQDPNYSAELWQWARGQVPGNQFDQLVSSVPSATVNPSAGPGAGFAANSPGYDAGLEAALQSGNFF